ncbi:hypothetical protein FQ137_00410 [Dietzia sp. ANT_WB102]|nr:hypothetical protein FQ137_00410 [Dietzia sp. ANT_WB102]
MTGFPLPLPRLSAPATRSLASADITDLRQLDGTSEKHVLALHGIGPSQLGAPPPAGTDRRTRAARLGRERVESTRRHTGVALANG